MRRNCLMNGLPDSRQAGPAKHEGGLAGAGLSGASHAQCNHPIPFWVRLCITTS